MMENEFDQELSRRIKAVFGQYEDPSADEGWNKLRERYPEEKKERFLLWYLLGTAASLLLIAGVWEVFRPGSQRPAVSESRSASRVLPGALSGGRPATGAGTPAGHGKSAVASSSAASSPADTYVAAACIAASPTLSGTDSGPGLMTSLQPALASTGAVRQELLPFAGISNEDPTQQIEWKELPDISRHYARKPGKSGRRSVTVDAFTGSYVSYARGSDHQPNIGGGLSSDIPLFGRLKLSTGIGLAPNSLFIASTDTGAQSAVVSQAFTRSPVPTFRTYAKAAYADPRINYGGYNASVLSLDIPVNLKYDFRPGRRLGIYILSGISSDAVVHENYSFHYTTGGSYNSAGTGYDVSQGSGAGSNRRLNLGRLLNLAVGFSRPLGSKINLNIEPFVKYPLRGIGSRQLQLGYGGINLKIGFKTGRQ